MKTFWLGGLFLLFVWVAVNMAMKNHAVPAGLGLHHGKLSPLPVSPNAVSSQTDDLQRKVEPLPYAQNRLVSRQRLLQVIQSEPRSRILVATDDYIHAVYTVPFIPFNDDVEFLFDELERAIHLRSASRVGWSDLGVNRKRVEKMRRQYLSTNS